MLKDDIPIQWTRNITIAGRVNTFIAKIKVYGLFVRSRTLKKS